MTEQDLMARIEELVIENNKLKEANQWQSNQLNQLPDQIRDRLIDQMRRTAVNCGASSACAVAGWCTKSTERKQ